MEIKRDTFWMIGAPVQTVFYILATISMLIFVYGFFRRFLLWQKGKRERIKWSDVKANFSYLYTLAVKQQKVKRDKLFGSMHRFISYGFVVLFIGTVLVFIDYDFNIPILRGGFYLVYKAVLDIFGLLFLLGLVAVVTVRTRKKRPRLLHSFLDQAFLWLMIFIGISGFLLEAIRLAETNVPYAVWSPVGYSLARLLFGNTQNLPGIYTYFWLGHAVLAFVLIAIIPYTKLFHFIIAPINIFLQPVKRTGKISSSLRTVSGNTLEEGSLYEGVEGVLRIGDFTNMQLLSTDACTECGRCDSQCPAYLSGKPLSPRSIVMKIRDRMPAGGEIASFISVDELQSCTTCAACVEACPVSINQLDLIIAMRRGLMRKGIIGEQAENVLIQVEEQYNIWGKPWSERGNWSTGLNVPRLDLKTTKEDSQ